MPESRFLVPLVHRVIRSASSSNPTRHRTWLRKTGSRCDGLAYVNYCSDYRARNICRRLDCRGVISVPSDDLIKKRIRKVNAV